MVPYFEFLELAKMHCSLKNWPAFILYMDDLNSLDWSAYDFKLVDCFNQEVSIVSDNMRIFPSVKSSQLQFAPINTFVTLEETEAVINRRTRLVRVSVCQLSAIINLCHIYIYCV